MVTELKENQVFVFGSNINGEHVGGAAKQAYQDFGAIYGVGFGMQGQSYAIPTMLPVTKKEMEVYINQFIKYARLTPEKEYLVTPIGTGIAGYTCKEMDELWGDELPDNIKLLWKK